LRCVDAIIERPARMGKCRSLEEMFGWASDRRKPAGLGDLVSLRFHHRFQSLRAQIKPIRPAGHFREIPFFVKGLRHGVDGINDDSDKRKSLSRLEAIAQSLREKSTSKS